MPPRFQEICALLLKGTENGSLSWSEFKTSESFTVVLKGTVFVLDSRFDFDLEEWDSISLRVLSDKGDEVDSMSSSPAEPDFEQLMALRSAIKTQREKSMTARLRPITEALRASVLGGGQALR